MSELFGCWLVTALIAVSVRVRDVGEIGFAWTKTARLF
jgi:hypothetical protein